VNRAGAVVLFGLAYVGGSFPVAQTVAARRGVDLRRVGDRNPGAWNAFEHVGPRAGALVVLGDGLKGALAAGLGRAVGGFPGGVVGATGAMLGQMFPCFEQFRGGRGVMCLTGAALVLAPGPTAAACALTAGLGGAGVPPRRAAAAGIVAQPLLAGLTERGRRRARVFGAWVLAVGVRSAEREWARRRGR
jgi:glycerol-3-phosphate acyltransferase PlsY